MFLEAERKLAEKDLNEARRRLRRNVHTGKADPADIARLQDLEEAVATSQVRRLVPRGEDQTANCRLGYQRENDKGVFTWNGIEIIAIDPEAGNLTLENGEIVSYKI